MTRPNFCPGCGSPLPAGPHGAQPFKDSTDEGADRGWDCYCDACKWSGDIMPDDETGDEATRREAMRDERTIRDALEELRESVLDSEDKDFWFGIEAGEWVGPDERRAAIRVLRWVLGDKQEEAP